jgi:hypothetical protein
MALSSMFRKIFDAMKLRETVAGVGSSNPNITSDISRLDRNLFSVFRYTLAGGGDL